ncbi:hypothetical protein LZ30DRAFT_292553 [Colletotrichum cereale]|nr:hypothetical protein LZ30DRAFT_292553 [Colletotrichum cereale]
MRGRPGRGNMPSSQGWVLSLYHFSFHFFCLDADTGATDLGKSWSCGYHGYIYNVSCYYKITRIIIKPPPPPSRLSSSCSSFRLSLPPPRLRWGFPSGMHFSRDATDARTRPRRGCGDPGPSERSTTVTALASPGGYTRRIDVAAYDGGGRKRGYRAMAW